MENLYLSPDESILLTSQNIVVDGIRHEAVLTDRRLILVKGDDPKAPHRALPLAAISSAIAGENALREPTITLAITAPDGVLQTLQLVFIRLANESRNYQYDEWVNRLKERITVTVEHPERTFSAAFQDTLSGEPGASHDLPGPDGNHVPGALPEVPSYVFRPPKPVVVTQETPIQKIAVVIVVIAVIAVAVILAAQFLQPGKPATAQGSPVPLKTTAVQQSTAVNPSPTPTQSVTPEVTQAPPSEPQLMIPQKGVWVRIQYPGSYLGSVGTHGSLREINSTGDQFFQIPASAGIIEAEIRKGDGSGDLLMFELYQDGSLVQRKNLTAPNGILYVNQPL